MDYDSYIKQPLPFEKEIDNIFKPDQPLIIFEIGSCEGEDSIRLKQKFPNAAIYTFEPLPGNIKKIKKNFKRYGLPGDKVFQIALGDSNGTAEFHVSSGHPEDLPKTKDWDYGNKSSSLLPPKMTLKTHKWLKFNKKIKVKTQRLDSFCAEHNINHIDFAFIDVQGAELMVLQGAGNFLKKVKAIWMEVEAVELYAGQPLKNDVETFMAEQGFRKVKDTVDNISGDQLYVRDTGGSLKSLWRNRLKSNKLLRRLNRSRLSLIEVKSRHSQTEEKAEPEFIKTSYAQSGEDLIIKFLLDVLNIGKPVYVDIGAHHPRYINNTAIFYDNGSTGINIEPDPTLFEAFIKDRPLDINLNIGISPKAGQLDFHIMSTPTLNTFSAEEVANFEKEGFSVAKKVKLKTSNINDVIAQHLGAAPDFINLDAEGLDYEILQSFDFEKYAPAIWCIETISFSQSGRGVKDKKLINYLEAKGYMLYADTNINSIFIKESLWRR